MDFGSEAPTKNLRQQKVASYFCNLESFSFLKIRSILMEIWSNMWRQNWVGIRTTNLPSLEHGFWKWSSHQKSEATESCILLLQPRIYFVFENQINIDGDMVRYVVTKLSGNSDYDFAESRTWILEVTLQPKIWGDRKLCPTSATSNLSRFWKSDQYWWRHGPICGDKIELGLGLLHLLSSERTKSTDRWK